MGRPDIHPGRRPLRDDRWAERQAIAGAAARKESEAPAREAIEATSPEQQERAAEYFSDIPVEPTVHQH